MGRVTRVAGLAWADAVLEGVFFILQTYLTDIWKLSFTEAATFLNIWGGIYRILPIFFLFLAETALGSFVVLAFSAVSSAAGAVLLTVATAPVLGNTISQGRCQETESCVGHTEKILFLTGMALIALGRAARTASTDLFMEDEADGDKKHRPSCSFRVLIVFFFITPAVVIFAFPYVKKWYVLFGLSAACATLAALYFLSGALTYKRRGPNPKGSPLTDIFRVLVAAAFKRSQPLTRDVTQLHRVDGEEFEDLSYSRTLGFLNKAAIILPGDGATKKSWRDCSVSQVESVKTIIRMAPLCVPFIIFGIVSSAGNTYFVEQASHMNTRIGSWNAPIQLLLLQFTVGKYLAAAQVSPLIALGKYGAILGGLESVMFSVLCCTVAAAVERRRLHVVKRHHMVDLPDSTKIPMSAFWLVFQVAFLSCLDAFSQSSLAAFHLSETPKSMSRYQECFGEAVTGLGFVSSALAVYVVGKMSETGSGKGWFRETLNRSRLDRYYWVLSVLTALNVFGTVFMMCNYSYKKKREGEEEQEIEKNLDNLGLELIGIKKTSAFGLLIAHLR